MAQLIIPSDAGLEIPQEVLDALGTDQGVKPAGESETVQQLDGAIRKATLPEDLVLYRLFNAQDVSQLQEGAKFTDAGYVSASLDHGTVLALMNGNAGTIPGIMRIHTNQGQTGAYLEQQFEVVLPRGSQFHIDHISKKQLKGRTVVYYDVTYLDQKTKKTARLYFDPAQPRDEHGRWVEWPGHGEQNETLMKPLRAAELNIHAKKIEEAHVFDLDGKEILVKKGSGDEVKFSPEEAAKFKNSVFTHNHPNGSSFSPEDVQLAIAENVKEMRVAGTTPSGHTYIYRMVRPRKGWPDGNKMADVFDRIATEEYNLGAKRLADKIAHGADEALWVSNENEVFWHHVWSRISDELNMNYTRTTITHPTAGA